jgi:hypothetical protein
MRTTTEEQEPKSEFAAAADSDRGPRNAVEERAVRCFEQLEKAERNFAEGMQFGQSMIDLREFLPHGQWMPRLKDLGISYAKARYWMAVADRRPINRGKAKAAPAQPTSWDVATDKFEKLSSGIVDLYSRQPDGFEGLVELLHELASTLGYDLIKKGGANA